MFWQNYTFFTNPYHWSNYSYAGKKGWIDIPRMNPTFWQNYIFFTNPYHWTNKVFNSCAILSTAYDDYFLCCYLQAQASHSPSLGRTGEPSLPSWIFRRCRMGEYYKHSIQGEALEAGAPPHPSSSSSEILHIRSIYIHT